MEFNINTQELKETNSKLSELLTNLNEQIEGYETQDAYMKENYQPNETTKETQLDQKYGLIKLLENIFEIEQNLMNVLPNAVQMNSGYFIDIQNLKEILDKEYNDIVDEMKKENKEKNKNERPEKYKYEKDEIEKLYIETDEIKERRIEKEKRRKEKEEKRRQEEERKRKEEEEKQKRKEEKEKAEKMMEQFFPQLVLENEDTIERIEKIKNNHPFFSRRHYGYDYLLKITLLGDTCIGAKTSLTNRFVNNTFKEMTFSTIGADFLTKEIESCGKKVNLQIVCYFILNC